VIEGLEKICDGFLELMTELFRIENSIIR